jgi:hypothetical protein
MHLAQPGAANRGGEPPSGRDFPLGEFLSALGRIHFMAPACDGEVAFLQHGCAFGGDERIDLRAVAIIAMNELLVLAKKHERGVIGGRQWSKTFAHCHSGVTRGLRMRAARGRY